jgi:hypothetical protein
MSNKRSLEETKEALANRLVTNPGAAADARASAPRVRANAALPKPDRPVKAAFIARAMQADWPLKGAQGNG